jgi:hypothetical protein
MIIAKSKKYPDGVRVDGLCNRGGYFKRTWLIEIGCGFLSFFLVAEGDNPGEALDAYADSKWADITRVDDDDYQREYKALYEWQEDVMSAKEFKEYVPDRLHQELLEQQGWEHLGNYGHLHKTSDLRTLEECRVNYFAKKGDCHEC